MRNKEILEFVLKNEKEIKIAVRNERLDPSGSIKTGGTHGHSRISDPTANTAVRRAMCLNYVFVDSVKLYKPEIWLQALQDTKKLLENTEQAQYMYCRYCQNLRRGVTCYKMKITKSRYYILENEVLHTLELFAVKYGILTPKI